MLKNLKYYLGLMRGLGKSRTSGMARHVGRGRGRHKPPYRPGTIGLSAVSEAIIKDHGRHVDRRTRKLIAKRTGKPFKAYYNGPVHT